MLELKEEVDSNSPAILDTLEVEVLVPEYIYVTDTVTIYEDILDTLYVDVIQEVEVVVYDTIVEVEYVEFIEYITEYIDCETGMPCNSSINELINKSSGIIQTGVPQPKRNKRNH